MIATDEYSANDALALIDVEYEPLPAVVNARKALDPDAPLIRDDKAGQRDNLASPTWEAGDETATDRAFAEADTIVDARHHLSALSSGAARDVRHHRRLQSRDRPAEHLQRQPGAARAPHRLRARRRTRRAHDPDPVPGHRRRLRQQGPGLPGLRLRDRRLDRRRRPDQVGREPLGEPHVHGVRTRLRDARRDVLEGRQDHRPAGRRDRRPRRVRQHRAADEVPGRVLPHRLRLVRPRRRARPGQGRLHEQGAGRRRLSLLVPDHGGRVPRRADGRRARPRAEGRPDRAAHAQLHRTRAVPVRDDHRLDVRLGQLRGDDAGRDGHRRLRGPAPRAGGEACPRRVDGHRRVVLHRGRRRRAAQAHGHPRARDERRRRPARAPVGQGGRQHQRPDAGTGARDDVRPDRRRGARHPARGRRGPPRRHRPLAVRARDLRQPLDTRSPAPRSRSSRARCATRRA